MLAVGQLPDDTVVTAFNIALNFHNLGLSRVEGAALGLFQNADIYIYISIIGPEVKQSYENHRKPC